MNVTGTVNVPDRALLEIFRGSLQPEADALVMGLSDSTFVPSLALETVNDVAGELVGFGYARQGLTGVLVSIANGIAKLASDFVTFEALGGDLTARYWWLYDDTHAEDLLLAYGLIDQGDKDVVILDGQPLVMRQNANGIMRLKRAA